MCHSGPLSRFTNLSFSSRKITVSHQSFTVLTDFNNFYPQFLLTIFTHNIFTDFHRSSQIFTGLSCHSASIFSFSTWHPVSKIFTDLPQIFQRSFKNFPSSIPFHLVPGQSVIPAHSPVFHRSSQVYLAIQPLFIHFLLGILSPRSSQIFHRSFKDLSKIFLPPSPFTWYLDSLSFRPTLQISKFSLSSLISTVHHRSLTNLPKLLFFLHPFLLGIWTVGHSGPLSRSPSFSFPPFSLHFVADSPQVFQNSLFLYPLLLIIWTVGHSGPLSSSPSPSISSLIPTLLHRSFTDLPRGFSSSFPYYLVSGQSVILPIFPRWRIHTKLLTKLP